MTTINNSSVRGPFYPGEKRWLKWNIADQLDTGQTIASATFTIESPVTLIGSATIYTLTKSSDSVKAQFDFSSAIAGTRYSITAAMTTNDGEVIKETIIAQVKALPT